MENAWAISGMAIACQLPTPGTSTTVDAHTPNRSPRLVYPTSLHPQPGPHHLSLGSPPCHKVLLSRHVCHALSTLLLPTAWGEDSGPPLSLAALVPALQSPSPHRQVVPNP